MGKASRNKKLKRERKPFLNPSKLPAGVQEGDLVAYDKHGKVYPLGPELLGDSWENIRKFLAPLDRSRMFTLEDLKRIDDTEH